jgi:hypothetical protein
MNCALCNADNPEGAKYCNICGVRLDLSSGPLKDTLEASVRQEVDRALQRYSKEQKIVEFDITERVTNRLLGWAKILGTLGGVLLVVASLIGVKSLKDLYDASKKELRASVDSAKKDVEKQKTELSKLTSDYTDLHNRYTQLGSKLPEYEKIGEYATKVQAQIVELNKSLAEQDDKIVKLGSQVQTLAAHIGQTDVLYYNSAIAYASAMRIDADGAYHGYSPDSKLGLDFLSNAGTPGNWWGLVTDTGTSTGNPVIQTPADPAPGFYVSFTALQDPQYSRSDPRRYVNSEAVNYIVLPGQLLRENAIAGKVTIQLGDLGVAIRPETGAHEYAIVADISVNIIIGEGSIALAKALGISSDVKTGGAASGIVYVVFPGSGQGRPLSKQNIDQKGATLFSNWGGMDAAKKVFPKLNWQ